MILIHKAFILAPPLFTFIVFMQYWWSEHRDQKALAALLSKPRKVPNATWMQRVCWLITENGTHVHSFTDNSTTNTHGMAIINLLHMLHVLRIFLTARAGKDGAFNNIYFNCRHLVTTWRGWHNGQGCVQSLAQWTIYIILLVGTPTI